MLLVYNYFENLKGFETFKISIPQCILVTFLIIITLKGGKKKKTPAICGTCFLSLEVALEKIMIYLRCCSSHSEGEWMVVFIVPWRPICWWVRFIRQEYVGACAPGSRGVIAEKTRTLGERSRMWARWHCHSQRRQTRTATPVGDASPWGGKS